MSKSLSLEMLDFISKSPSPYHCVATAAELLSAGGFLPLDERADWGDLKPGQMAFLKRGGSLLAFRVGEENPAKSGFRIFGAHTDSPNLRLKPKPDQVKEGYRQWGVEVYGGVILATWTDRDLGLSGRVMVEGSGGPEAKLVRIDRPLARIPNLAIHLNRNVNSEGLKLDSQKHLPPVVGLGDEGPLLQDLLAPELGQAKILSWDLGLHDLQAPSLGGFDDAFVFAPRIDNQSSCFAALKALLAAKPTDATQVVILFDHEEVGSRSYSGAMGAFLRDALARMVRQHAKAEKGGLERAIPSSLLVSLDAAHAIHPNYADVHEPNHKPAMNNGPVIKEHAEQRYATDAETMAIFKLACRRADVPHQEFVIRTDLACGSTIGPISAAQLGIRTVDVGVAMLSMHSIREQCGSDDVNHLIGALGALLSSNDTI
jgi:aspartyl aminopeptidase